MSNRRALLVGCSVYEVEQFARLRSPVYDIESLSKVLADPDIGAFQTQTLLNEPEHIVRRAVSYFLRNSERDDTLLLHFACHGQKDETGQLFLAASDTDSQDLSATAFSADLLCRLIDRSPSQQIIVLLDCCYSGAISRAMMPRSDGAVHVNDILSGQGQGRAIITATKDIEYAWEPGLGETMLLDEPVNSVFVAAVVGGLSSGEADLDCDGLISIDDLFNYVSDYVKRETVGEQTPGRLNFLTGNIYIAKVISAGDRTRRAPLEAKKIDSGPEKRRKGASVKSLPTVIQLTSMRASDAAQWLAEMSIGQAVERLAIMPSAVAARRLEMLDASTIANFLTRMDEPTAISLLD